MNLFERQQIINPVPVICKLNVKFSGCCLFTCKQNNSTHTQFYISNGLFFFEKCSLITAPVCKQIFVRLVIHFLRTTFAVMKLQLLNKNNPLLKQIISQKRCVILGRLATIGGVGQFVVAWDYQQNKSQKGISSPHPPDF